MNNDSRLYVVDGYGFVFRAYHVQPPLTAPDGSPTGALYGFASMLLKMISEFRPENIIVVFDSGSKNLRHDIYAEYKANRPPAPEDLKMQLPLVREVAQTLGFPTIEHEGYEADDVIATLVTKNAKIGIPSTIISSDKDLMQLIDGDMIRMYDPLKNRMITEEIVQEKFGISSTQVHDYLSLVGDSSDNIPGVPGVGAKTAALLLNQFKNLHGILSNIDKIEKPRFAKLMQEHQEKALLSWKLAELHRDVPIDIDLNKLHWSKTPSHEVLAFTQKFGFKSLESRCARIYGAPDRPVASAAPKAEATTELETKYEVVHTNDSKIIDGFWKQIDESGFVSCSYNQETTQIILATESEMILTLDLLASSAKPQQELFALEATTTPHLPKILELLQNPAIQKIIYDKKNFKHQLVQSLEQEVNILATEDLMLMEYCLKASVASKDFPKFLEDFNVINTEHSTGYFHRIYNDLKRDLISEKLYNLYKQVDLPIADILYHMEQTGFTIDTAYLNELSQELTKRISTLDNNIYAIAGEEFNIASTKQLGSILFEKLELPTGKKSGKSKAPSTGAETLEKLSEEGYEIADHLLAWRHLTKLKNTYTDSLPKNVNQSSGRVHTTFLQTSTATSRLSSVEPNLQNIPIRTEEGSKIRKAFVSAKGHKLIFADYSQIELRILSQIADIQTLQDAFLHGEDIHKKTASQIFNLPISEITSEIRYKAKAINFGIIYGMSAFGLAKQLGISRTEAATYIENYFIQYPGIKEYMDNTKNFAEENGFVENIFGRKLYIPLINNKNHSLRSFAQRAAINAPIQGTAADIAKLAMISVNKALAPDSIKAKMLLQVHDELIFEVDEKHTEQVQNIIVNSMQNCAANYFNIPLKVDVNIKDNWSKN